MLTFDNLQQATPSTERFYCC